MRLEYRWKMLSSTLKDAIPRSVIIVITERYYGLYNEWLLRDHEITADYYSCILIIKAISCTGLQISAIHLRNYCDLCYVTFFLWDGGHSSLHGGGGGSMAPVPWTGYGPVLEPCKSIHYPNRKFLFKCNFCLHYMWSL